MMEFENNSMITLYIFSLIIMVLTQYWKNVTCNLKTLLNVEVVLL